MNKEVIKLLLKELFKSGEIKIKSEYDKTMDKDYISIYIDEEKVFSENPLHENS